MDAESRLMMQQVAEETAKKTVSETLTRLGVDHQHPIEIQKDFATLRELRVLIEDPEVQADLLHLRRWRVTMNAVESKGVLVGIGMAILGLGVLVYMGVGAKFGIK
jgi:hypothetical protein